MFWTALLIVPTLFFVKTAVDYIYPDEIKILMMKAGWNVMELCSRVEIYATQIYNNYIPALLPKKQPQQMIKFICDGDEVGSYTYNEFTKKKKNIIQCYDFILYEIPILNQTIYEKYDRYIVRYQNVNDVLKMEYNAMKLFELNMIEITINETHNHSIDLGRNQFMVSGNVLFDRPFLKWYLNTFKNIVLDDEDKYVLTFIDHNMNYITLPDYCYLLIKKNNYDIINDVSVSEASVSVSEANVSVSVSVSEASVSVSEASVSEASVSVSEANVSVSEATASVSEATEATI